MRRTTKPENQRMFLAGRIAYWEQRLGAEARNPADDAAAPALLTDDHQAWTILAHARKEWASGNYETAGRDLDRLFPLLGPEGGW